MKTWICIFLLLVSVSLSHAQTITVLNIDTKGVEYDPVQMGNLVRIELDKLQQFQVTDKYDVAYLIERNKLEVGNCYGKICLVDVGKVIKSDKMFTGSVEKLGQTLVVSLRLIDVTTEKVEKSYIKEYLFLPTELQSILRVSIREFFSLENDTNLVEKLSKKETFDNTVNNPYQSRLKLDGPRMGFTVFTGELADYLKAPNSEGGFNAHPVMFQFGYQFETQYLNEGNFQALFEFVPMVTGIDQGLLFPSLTILHGLRSNKNGWEFAFGPSVSFVPESEGFFQNGQWVRKEEVPTGTTGISYVRRVDSRGDLYWRSGFVLAFGKSFRSGKLNIPVNAYVIPNREGLRFGASFGFNAKNAKAAL